MKTETFKITESDIQAFKDAIEELRGITLISYENEQAIISYTWEHNLFHLGQMYQLQKTKIWI